MKFIADFHIHSHFSVATSASLTPEHLEYWARLKGIDVIGTGDCVHPGWLAELRDKLEPAGNGLFRLKKDLRLEQSRRLAGPHIPGEVFFMLSGEVSSIYKKDGRVRKVHNVCIFPDFAAAEKVQARLEKVGNIRSDGRPILGLDSKYLLEMVLESDPMSELVPAHIWTPWFSVLGSMSGFDSIDECYEDLTQHIHAVETGLSSDPPMNWSCSFLDRFKLVSNSDAHSPEKLGREANIFDGEVSYNGIIGSLRGPEGFLGTIEFFPQEGKYHLDGHRKCGVCWNPLETARHGGLCPVCGRAVTKGVMYRVAELADRTPGPDGRPAFYSITRLPELLAEALGQKSAAGKSVRALYGRMIEDLGSEFHILLFAEIADIEQAAGDRIAGGIARLRRGEVAVEDGYDGEFGRVSVFGLGPAVEGRGLFEAEESARAERVLRPTIDFDVDEFRALVADSKADTGAGHGAGKRESARAVTSGGLNPEQERAVAHAGGPCMVLAGPGSGKTRILTERARRLIGDMGVLPENILAITFSNKAASEIRDRIAAATGAPVDVMTFHSFGLGVLKDHFDLAGREVDFLIIDEDERMEILNGLAPAGGANAAARAIEAVKDGRGEPAGIDEIFESYNRELGRRNAVDLADLICLPVKIFCGHPDIASRYREKYRYVLVDEFQDINARQYEMLAHLAGGSGGNLFVIGDPDQAIYGFRGSDVRFIEKMKHDFEGLEVIRLSRSYRCPGTVLKAGSLVIGGDSPLEGVALDMKVRIQETESERSEADWIAAAIEEMMGGVRSFSMDSGISDGRAQYGGQGFSDIAVLCRSSFMFGPLCEAMANHGIPCQVTETDPFYRRGPLADALRYFRRIHAGKGESLEGDDLAVSEMIAGYRPVSEVLARVFGRFNPAPEEAGKLLAVADSYRDDYEGFFRALALRTGVDDYDPRAESVSIMTIHASKGLEFGTVFIPGCEDGIIPMTLFGDRSDDRLKEEERLLYVGMTRTVSRLYLSHARKRAFRGRILAQKRSPLLDRIEKDLVNAEKRRSAAVDDGQLEMF